MKEPSELDITLVRDFMTKMSWSEWNGGEVIRARYQLSSEQLLERRDALERVLHQYSLMTDEISRLVLEKNNLD
ncbi:hypothetical protein [Rhizobium phage RHEph16]|uniref:Uncharacterized protein n=1 Tax=Rhizobium phage RHEph16 TaxID=2836132 RepID=A0AAE7VM97_9CAUD|nr:hypothetical protein PP750_gp88 [Rhizobium phage RHEph16]QXV74403.1 hypothetical protein [Rhizobium phage RHEph16]